MPPPADAILYSFRRCPYAMRARFALAISGVRCELREVKLAAKPASMLAISPKGTVPVLQRAEGIVLEESLDIMLWALSCRDPEGWLERKDADLIGENDGTFKRHLDGYKYPERHDGDPLIHRAKGLEFLRLLDQRLSTARQLCGGERGLTDAAVMPFVRQFAAVDRTWFDAQTLPHLQPWLAGYLSSALFAAIMVRVPPWTPGDPVVPFPPASLDLSRTD